MTCENLREHLGKLNMFVKHISTNSYNVINKHILNFSSEADLVLSTNPEVNKGEVHGPAFCLYSRVIALRDGSA
jgi:hypothetical protein